MHRLALVIVVFFAGCTTPQIPLPPPEFSTFAVSVDANNQQIRIQGELGAASGGELLLRDLKTGIGIIRPIADNGRFDTGFFDAVDGQQFDLRYSDGAERSDPSCMEVDYSPPRVFSCPP
jgi:hypothetical protein